MYSNIYILFFVVLCLPNTMVLKNANDNGVNNYNGDDDKAHNPVCKVSTDNTNDSGVGHGNDDNVRNNVVKVVIIVLIIVIMQAGGS